MCGTNDSISKGNEKGVCQGSVVPLEMLGSNNKIQCQPGIAARYHWHDECSENIQISRKRCTIIFLDAKGQKK